MILVGYIRCSTSEQDYGLDAQQARITQACQQRGHELANTYRDEGHTGKHLDRPGLRTALQVVAQGLADGLIVAKLDRLTRSVIDFGLLLEWFQQANGALVCLDPEIDMSTPTGRLMAHMVAAMAEWERDMIAQRTKDGLEAARARGVRVGLPAVAEHPEIVQRIRDLRDSGESLRAICAQLEADGVPTVRGGVWAPSTVLRVLGYRPPRRGRRLAVLPEIGAK